MLTTIVVFIIVLSILIFVHEFGHFLAARRSGIGVEEFGFGLPPRIWGRKIGKTLYSVNWLPFGGFVRLVGEDPEKPQLDRKDSFYSKPLRFRSIVVSAGVLANVALAVFLFYIILSLSAFKFSLPLFIDHNFRFANQIREVLVMDVSPDSPADLAGMKLGDVVLTADGTEIKTQTDFQKIIRQNESQGFEVSLRNISTGEERSIMVTPSFNEDLGVPALGIILGELATIEYKTFGQKLFSGFSHSVNILEYSGKILWIFIKSAFETKNLGALGAGVAGPVGIAQITGEAVSAGFVAVLQFVAILSLNLAVINILPLPALDGGRLLFLGLEAVFRKRVYPGVEKWIHSIGMALLLGLILLITLNDIRRIFS